MTEPINQGQPPQVGFGAVAAESVHESVEQEREITRVGDGHPGVTEPYAGHAATADEVVAVPPDPGAGSGPEATPELEVDRDEEGWDPPSGDQVVNSITAATRR